MYPAVANATSTVNMNVTSQLVSATGSLHSPVMSRRTKSPKPGGTIASMKARKKPFTAQLRACAAIAASSTPASPHARAPRCHAPSRRSPR